MASLIDLRRRIRSVKNTQQITKAMKMVSASKLRAAQHHALESRPYGEMMTRLVANISQAAAALEESKDLPLLQVREEKRIRLLLVTSDTGLAGAFNSNLLRMVQGFLDKHRDAEIDVEALGRKGRDYFRRRNRKLSGEHVGVVDKPNYEQAREIADGLIHAYSHGEIDAVYLAGNEFKSVLAPKLTLRRILPIELEETRESEKDRKSQGNGERDNRGSAEGEKNDQPIDYIFEQPPGELLKEILPKYIEMVVYRAMLESISAYHAARMTAMDSATSNAGDVISDLTLQLNRARQAGITREIIEIVSGAAALG